MSTSKRSTPSGNEISGRILLAVQTDPSNTSGIRKRDAAAGRKSSTARARITSVDASTVTSNCTPGATSCGVMDTELMVGTAYTTSEPARK